MFRNNYIFLLINLFYLWVVLLASLKQTTGFKNVRSVQERYYENPLVLSVQESEKFHDHCKKKWPRPIWGANGTRIRNGRACWLTSIIQRYFILTFHFLFRFTIQINNLFTFLYILTIEESFNWCRESCESFVLLALYHITVVRKVWWELERKVKMMRVLFEIHNNQRF
jgi:hypothetical protein